MSNPIVTEVNCVTGETIEREMTLEEYTSYLEAFAGIDDIPAE